MRVALVYPQRYQPNPFLDPDWEEPIGLGYVAAAAEAAGHSCSLFVPSGTWDELVSDVVKSKPDVLGLQVYTSQVPDALYVAGEVKRFLPAIKVVAGGPHPSALSLPEPIDYNVVGEGEEAFLRLLEGIEGKVDPSQPAQQVRGVTLTGSREAVSVPRIEDLDRLPLPKRMSFDPRRGEGTFPCSLVFPPPSGCGWTSMVASRGCRNSCRFCSSPSFWGRKIRFRSVENVIAEIRFLQEEQGVNLIFFEDLTFSQDEQYVAALCRRLIEERLEMNWWCQTSPTIDPKLLPLMRRAGCRTIAFGVEDLDDTSLRKMGKAHESPDTYRTLQIAADLGILVWAYYVIGFPWQNADSIMASAVKLAQLPIHRLRLSIATPLPGSAWYEEFEPEDLDPDWSRYDTNHLVYHHPSVSPEKMKELQYEMFEMFYGSPDYDAHRSQIVRKHPELADSFEEHLAYVRQFI